MSNPSTQHDCTLDQEQQPGIPVDTGVTAGPDLDIRP